MLNRRFAVLALLLVLLLFPTAGAALTGGPDAGGYTFYDSTEAGVEKFSWSDITREDGFTGGFTLSINTISEAIPIGFTFTFYGNTYSQIHISSRGYLTFEGMPAGTKSILYSRPNPIPTAGGADDNFIAGLWGYLRPDI